MLCVRVLVVSRFLYAYLPAEHALGFYGGSVLYLCFKFSACGANLVV